MWKIEYLYSLLCVAVAVILIFIYYMYMPKEENRRKKLVVDMIPSALVVLIGIPLYFFLFTAIGIKIKQEIIFNEDKIAYLVVQKLKQENINTIEQSGNTKVMDYIDSEINKIMNSSVSPNEKEKTQSENNKEKKDIFVVIDIQNDFFERGHLPVKDAESLISPLNEAIKLAEKKGIKIVFTQDWHPKGHKSFEGNGGNWSEHCVHGTWGSSLREGLYRPLEDILIKFGKDPSKLGYSPFEDEEMCKIVSDASVQNIYVAGIATEYCVLATCIDARKYGKNVYLIGLLTRAAKPEKLNEIWSKLEKSGINKITCTLDELALIKNLNKPPCFKLSLVG